MKYGTPMKLLFLLISLFSTQYVLGTFDYKSSDLSSESSDYASVQSFEFDSDDESLPSSNELLNLNNKRDFYQALALEDKHAVQFHINEKNISLGEAFNSLHYLARENKKVYELLKNFCTSNFTVLDEEDKVLQAGFEFLIRSGMLTEGKLIEFIKVRGKKKSREIQTISSNLAQALIPIVVEQQEKYHRMKAYLLSLRELLFQKKNSKPKRIYL